MKNIFLIVSLLIFLNTRCFAEEIKSPLDYLDRDYVGVPFEQALNSNKPTMLIFASSKDIGSLFQILPIGKFIYKEYKNDFNFTILNTDKIVNTVWIRTFAPAEFPALYIVDADARSYIFIDKRNYKKKALKKIIEEYKKGTL